MEGIRLRLVGLVEWVAAAACVLLVLGVAAMATRELRTARPMMMQVKAAAALAPVAPASLRAGAISVPEIVLPDGKRLTRGGPASVLAALGPRAQIGLTAIERVGNSQRESRTYRYAGMEFVVVTGDDQIIAIYR
jgi:hypothetical protein